MSNQPAVPAQPKKGFRNQPKQTKAQIAVELATKVNNITTQMQFVGNMLSQLMQGQRRLSPEVDALTSLAATTELETATPIAKGDHVMLDYLGVLTKDDGSNEVDADGLPRYFDGGFGQTFVLQNVGGGTLIPGFEDQLIGHKAGETFQIKVQFPENYGAKEMASKKATFNIHIHRVFRPLAISPVAALKFSYDDTKLKIAQRRAEAEAAKKASEQPTETKEQSAAPQTEGKQDEQK